jgi:BirA family transcriptional regulator, biotin operon repressor / biotin---[acetyl-CoA-carboxylase] ligase
MSQPGSRPQRHRRRPVVAAARRGGHAPEPLSQRIYRLLSHGRFHSGQVLAEHCAVSRSAVWQAIATLRTLGVEVQTVANRGYRLPLATPLLDSRRIVEQLPAAVATQLLRGNTCWQTGSTNSELLEHSPVSPGQFEFLGAEYQTAGRGRRTRRWLAPPGGAICLSLSWCFASMPANVGALSLAIGVCVLRALASVGSLPVTLKWPNDLVAGPDKLGGILAELRAEADGPALVVVGIGLNVALGRRLMQELLATGARSTDLASLGVSDCDRNRLAAALLSECVEGLRRFDDSGFESFIGDWRGADALAGKPVLVSAADGVIAGHARGIDVAGALCVQTREGLKRFATGEVSVRATG